MALYGDPTVLAIRQYFTRPEEILIAWALLLLVGLMEFFAKFTSLLDSRSISSTITRTPESIFQLATEPFSAHYLYVKLFSPSGEMKNLRMHFLDEGDPHASEIIVCLHGEPFWSHSFHKLIPLLTRANYRVIVPDLIGFGRSDKFIDHRAYSLELHKESLLQLLDHLNLTYRGRDMPKVTLIGHNWGALLGGTMLKDHPELFDRFVILNVNSFPDGELDPRRYPHANLFREFLVYDAFFLLVPAATRWLRNLTPFTYSYKVFNPEYSKSDLEGFAAPFRRKYLDTGGIISFPLMVPVFPQHRYAGEFRRTREFFASKWKKPTLVCFSEQAVAPFVERGDFIVGNRRDFFRILIPHAQITPRIAGGHVIMYDNPRQVSKYVVNFIQTSAKSYDEVA